MSRLEQLLLFAKEEPNDPFNIYAVAVEYLKIDTSKASAFFDSLVNEHPDYLPTYYTYGKLLQERKEYLKAKRIFEQGVTVGTRKMDSKALGELRNALSELEFEMDES